MTAKRGLGGNSPFWLLNQTGVGVTFWLGAEDDAKGGNNPDGAATTQLLVACRGCLCFPSFQVLFRVWHCEEQSLHASPVAKSVRGCERGALLVQAQQYRCCHLMAASRCRCTPPTGCNAAAPSWVTLLRSGPPFRILTATSAGRRQERTCRLKHTLKPFATFAPQRSPHAAAEPHKGPTADQTLSSDVNHLQCKVSDRQGGCSAPTMYKASEAQVAEAMPVDGASAARSSSQMVQSRALWLRMDGQASALGPVPVEELDGADSRVVRTSGNGLYHMCGNGAVCQQDHARSSSADCC